MSFKNRKSIILVSTIPLLLLSFLLFAYNGNHDTDGPYISEICSSNFSVVSDSFGNYTDYIELHNPSSESASMEGYYLSNNWKEPMLFSLAHLTIPADGYLVLWLDESMNEETSDGFHIPFQLNKSGDFLMLHQSDTNDADLIPIPPLQFNTSYSRTERGRNSSFRVTTCTPGNSNDAAEVLPAVLLPAPEFSAQSGFYNEEFTLSISSAQGTAVYYTTDGSIPTPDSTVYTEPIPIRDCSTEENVYSSITDVTTDLPRHVPDEPVDKATVIRAVAYNETLDTVSPVSTEVFFVGYENRADYDNWTITSLVSDPEGLFGFEDGIYVAGKGYADYKADGGFTGIDDLEVPASYTDEAGNTVHRYLTPNFFQQGREWERPATFSFFDSSHHIFFSGEVGIRISGFGSRKQLQKSFNVYARKNYVSDALSSEGTLQFPFFDYDGINKIRLRNGEDDPHFLDAFLQELVAERNVATQKCIPTALFLDGEYWGLYNIRELYTPAYFQHYYGVSPENLWLVKEEEVQEGPSDAQDIYHMYVDQILYADMSDEVQYAVVERAFDLNNLIDYYCLMLYLDNVDITSIHNMCYWRSDTEGADGHDEGKWRYVLYDLDGLIKDPADDTFTMFREADSRLYLPGALCANPAFREKFCISMMDIANTCCSYERAHNLLMEWKERYQAQAVLRNRRFGPYNNPEGDPEESYTSRITEIDSFFALRRDYIIGYLKADLSLEGEAVPVRIATETPEGGTITINTATLPRQEDWEGYYFTDYSITLTATPSDGYIFSGWGGDISSTEDTITVPLDPDGISLIAEFEHL